MKAMIEILQALPNTKLYKRLEAEGRLLVTSSGVCQDSTTNFVPKMDKQILVDGYNKLVKKAYSPKIYFERVSNFLKYYVPTRKIPVHKRIIPSLIKIALVLRHLKKSRIEFVKFMIKTLLTMPQKFPDALNQSVLYIHFSKVFN
jgi:hypothetical protein